MRKVVLAVLVGCGCGAAAPRIPAVDPATDLVDIAGATYVMGDAAGDPNEAPRQVAVASFRLMRHEVTNRQFAAFVAATGYRTDAERRGAGAVWDGRWRQVRGADWRHPRGPGSSLAGLDDHPVVQVSARDAAAYCTHHGLRLPSEEEWELAARGRDGRRYVWGDQPPTAGAARGNFGRLAPCCAADASDGWRFTAPVGRFRAGASADGLLDLAGNVWERTSSRFPGRPDQVVIRGAGWGNSAYCVRAAYRHGNPPDLGLDMVGVRCAADAAPAR